MGWGSGGCDCPAIWDWDLGAVIVQPYGIGNRGVGSSLWDLDPGTMIDQLYGVGTWGL